ncbi:MAG: serine/threonine protein kinase [Deltaproteobacteria bacterium]|nr:MAG: serine/threonine protein kinase [Deltaproteobacteria bacterium]
MSPTAKITAPVYLLPFATRPACPPPDLRVTVYTGCVPAAALGTIGRYELIEKIAVGGMAEIYRARVRGEHGFERQVAIKRILPHLAEDADFVAMFIDEAKLTAHLSHPKIVQVYELDAEGADLFIAMEFVDGVDLLTLVRQCRAEGLALPQPIAVHIVHEVLDALDYAHRASTANGAPLNIVHRDVSPGNVLLSRQGHVKLADFGIARAARRRYETQTGTLKGKYGYMSPEQVIGAPIDHRSDVFAAGVVLAELLMMRRLFTGPGDLDVLLMVRDVQLDRLDRYGAAIPPPLRALLDRALQRDPADRFATAGAFRDALGDWLFASGQRVTRRDVAAFMADLDRSESEKMRAALLAGEPVADEIAEVATLSGPATRARKLEAEQQARVGRELFRTTPGLEDADDSPSDDGIPIVFDDAPSAPVPKRAPTQLPEPGDAPDSLGTFDRTSPLRVLYRIGHHRLDGLLVVERGDAVKEAYFADGQPLFVRSNVLSERFGEYLVAQGAITADQLRRALALLPHFGGRLGDTLVGLRLMRPLDAFRQLTAQVRAKLVDVCTWTDGRYRWYAGRENPWPALPLHLNTFEILGAGAAATPDRAVSAWAARALDRRPRRARATPSRLDAFGLGERIAYVHAALDGATTVRDLIARFNERDRLDVLRLLRLLVEVDLAAL